MLSYLYFNIGRMAYLQANVLSAYVFLAPAIVAGVVTLRGYAANNKSFWKGRRIYAIFIKIMANNH